MAFPKTNNKCSICGKPIGGRKGNIHVACRPPGWKPKWKAPQNYDLDQALIKLQKETVEKLEGGIRRWRKDMGPEKLKELFPDMVGRI